VTRVAIQWQLLELLADGRFHSGQDLATALGLSRGAVWKQLRRLAADFELSLDAVRGKGYRLRQPLELLDTGRVDAGIDPEVRASIESVNLLRTVDSTNRCALEDPPAVPGRGRVWLAEHQTAGRGRRGRRWVSVYGGNLYMSLGWSFDLPMARLGGLSLVAGAVVAEVLEESGSSGHGLKWPNDVLVGESKLAGILLEAAGEAAGPAVAVIGIGINLRLSDPAATIDQPWTDWARAVGAPLSRNQLAGRLIDRLVRACREFSQAGLAPFIARWSRYDLLRGQRVTLLRGQDTIQGDYAGIAADGALRLMTDAGAREYHAGEVSVRRMIT
jgi:BirA family biotin operon repressor/biotin-[acetyl-CoA-carboxylase] ligase